MTIINIARAALLMASVLALALTTGSLWAGPGGNGDEVSAATGSARNVLLIIADDQSYDPIRTPTLEALGRSGTEFVTAYAAAASCSPSRSVLLTGLYPHTNGVYGLAHGVHNFHLVDGVATLPTLLKQAGYTTALVGKYHLLPESAFDFDAHLAPEAPGNRDVSHMAREAGRFMASVSGKQPFFLIMGYSDPHRAPINFGNTQQWPDVPRITYDPAELPVPASLPDLPEVRQDLAEYYESVRRLDTGVGLLIEELKAAGKYDDTLIVFVSDHGRPFPGAKATLYEDGIHVPMFVVSPDQRRRGVKSRAMASLVDVAPTILDWADAAHPADELPGRSLLPILENDEPAGWDTVFASHTFHEINQYYPMRALRNQRYKYIRNLAHELPFPVPGDVAESPSWQAMLATGAPVGQRSQQAFLRRPSEELYDLTTDPLELRNLADDPAHAAALALLRAELDQHRARTRDPWLPGQTTVHGHMTGH
ncbi:MAG: sulfatase [Pseudomonadota bacterium]|nr:sulfatase [Pseudomonadota bacterium]